MILVLSLLLAFVILVCLANSLMPHDWSLPNPIICDVCGYSSIACFVTAIYWFVAHVLGVH